MSWLHSRWLRAWFTRVAIVVAGAALLITAALWLQPQRADLSVVCSNNVESCRAVAQAYEDRTGVRVSVVRLPTSEALGRIKVPNDRPEFDVWLGGPAESYSDAADRGLLDPIGDLPSVRDLPHDMKDEHGYWAGVYGGVLALCVNTELVPDAPVSWDQLLQDEYDDQIIMSSPLLSGTAATMLWVQYSRGGSIDFATEYMAALDSRLRGYLDSGTAVARNVARGNAGIGISFAPYCRTEQRQGAPVKVVHPEEGTGYEIGAIGLLSGSERKPQTREFIDFAVSEAGQAASGSTVEQSRTTKYQHPNLTDELEALDVEVYGGDSLDAARVREELIREWSVEVRRGTY